MATELAATTDQEAHRKKKGLFGRLRRVNKNGGGNVDKRDPTPSPTQESNSQTRATEEVNFSAPSDDHKFDRSYSDEKSGSQMKQVRFPVKDAMKGKVPIRNRVELLKPPTAREAAFGGPPRYDWIDIVSQPYKRLKKLPYFGPCSSWCSLGSRALVKIHSFFSAVYRALATFVK